MSAPLLEVNDLNVNLSINGVKVTAIDHLNFQMNKGEVLGVVGESGCGKSMTANAIMRLLPKGVGEISNGSINFKGKNLLDLSEAQMRRMRGNHIAMIFQDPMTALNPVQKIGSQLMEMVRTHQKLSGKEAFRKSLAMLDKVGIPAAAQRMKEYPHQLSGGMRQRVMIAMALLCNPELLIADEPTTSLDVTIQAQILELIEQLKNELKMAVVLITHDMGVIAETADKVMVMYAGEMVEYAPVKDLFHNPLHPYTKGLLASIPRPDQDRKKLFTIGGSVANIFDAPSGCRFSGRCSGGNDRCKSQRPGLTVLSDEKQVRCWKYFQ